MSDSVQFDVRYIDCADTQIAYYTWGTGKPLVLLHGNGEDSRTLPPAFPIYPFLSRYRGGQPGTWKVRGRGNGKLNFDRMQKTCERCWTL